MTDNRDPRHHEVQIGRTSTACVDPTVGQTPHVILAPPSLGANSLTGYLAGLAFRQGGTVPLHAPTGRARSALLTDNPAVNAMPQYGEIFEDGRIKPKATR